MKQHHRYLISVAYGYLGSLAEAEDLVQEAYLRWEQTSQAEIQNVEAWLTTVVTRLAVDRIRSAQKRRETYTGEWLPEPVFQKPDAEQQAITQSKLSLALLYLLEKLEPEQRVVFVLREVFEYSYRVIGEMIGKSEAACRQLMTRARGSVNRAKSDPPKWDNTARSVIDQFIDALAEGNEEKLLNLLAPDAVLVGDGGGKAASVLNPISGADRIARFFAGIRRKNAGWLEVRPETVNSGAGVIVSRNGLITSVAGVTIRDGRITGIYSISNPDKLGQLQEPVQTGA